MVRANALNSVAQTYVWVDPQTGSDTLGNGSAMNPYATITNANSTITDAATGKRYTIMLMGTTTEAACAIKSFVNIFGCSPNASRIVVSGAGNNFTLDATWTNPASATISNIIFSSGTNVQFDTSALVGSLGNEITLINCEVGGAASWNGKLNNNGDTFICISCLLDNNLTVTNANLESANSTISGSVNFSSTSGHGPFSYTSESDVIAGNVAVSETAADTTTASFITSSITGTVTVTGATSSVTLDAVSYPQGGFSFVSSGKASTVQSIPNFVPFTNVTGATYTALFSDYTLMCNRAGTIAITLMTSPKSGQVIIVKDKSGAAATNNITITPASGNIDGSSSFVINTNYGSVTLIYNGTTWSVV